MPKPHRFRYDIKITQREYMRDYAPAGYVSIRAWVSMNPRIFSQSTSGSSWAKCLGRRIADFAIKKSAGLIYVYGTAGYIYSRELLEEFTKECVNTLWYKAAYLYRNPGSLEVSPEPVEEAGAVEDAGAVEEVAAAEEVDAVEEVAPWSELGSGYALKSEAVEEAVPVESPVIEATIGYLEDIPPRLLTEEEVANYLCLPVSKLKELRDSGKLIYRDIFGAIRYDRDVITQLGK